MESLEVLPSPSNHIWVVPCSNISQSCPLLPSQDLTVGPCKNSRLNWNFGTNGNLNPIYSQRKSATKKRAQCCPICSIVTLWSQMMKTLRNLHILTSFLCYNTKKMKYFATLWASLKINEYPMNFFSSPKDLYHVQRKTLKNTERHIFSKTAGGTKLLKIFLSSETN